MMTYRFNPSNSSEESKFAFKKDDLLKIIRELDSSFSFEPTQKVTTVTNDLNKKTQKFNIKDCEKKLLYKQPLLSEHEAACIISGDDPNTVNRCQNDTDFEQNFSSYLDALSFIASSTRSTLLISDNYNGVIHREDLREYLTAENIPIDGFNDDMQQQNNNFGNPSIGHATPEYYQQKNKELLEKIGQLEKELQQEKDQSFLLVLDDQSSQSEIKKLKESISEKDKKIEKLNKDVQKENGDVFGLDMELNKAKHDIDRLVAQIEQLKSNQLNSKTKEKNLLELIFDQSQTDKYAPDLVHSIRLWEALYVDNTASTDKHSNRSNYWIKTNTPYKNETSVEVKRLREITSPFDNWNSDRKKKLKSN